jgi:hypothetical protein
VRAAKVALTAFSLVESRPGRPGPRLRTEYAAKAKEFGTYPEGWTLFVYVTCGTV